MSKTDRGKLLYNSQVALCDYLKKWDRMREGSRGRGYILTYNFD